MQREKSREIKQKGGGVKDELMDFIIVCIFLCQELSPSPSVSVCIYFL